MQAILAQAHQELTASTSNKNGKKDYRECIKESGSSGKKNFGTSWRRPVSTLCIARRMSFDILESNVSSSLLLSILDTWTPYLATQTPCLAADYSTTEAWVHTHIEAFYPGVEISAISVNGLHQSLVLKCTGAEGPKAQGAKRRSTHHGCKTPFYAKIFRSLSYFTKHILDKQVR